MTDTSPPPASNDPANDGYEIRAAEASRDEAERDVDKKRRTVRQRISDAIEHVIPHHSHHDDH